MKKLIYIASPILSLVLVGVASIAKATDYSTSTLSTTFTTLISGIVNDLITLIVAIFTNNISIIIMLGVGISFVFWIIYKIRRAGHGG